MNISRSVRGKTKVYPLGRSGIRNPHSKLSLDQVTQIKKLFDASKGKTKMYKTLANQFNVSWGTIRNVVEEITYGN